MGEVSGSSVPRLPRGVRLHFDQVRSTHVLLAPERAFNVDARAVAVLQRVDGQRSITQIAADLATMYQADHLLIERDVVVMVDGLIAKRVLEAA